MQLRHIVAATDESNAGRQAVRTALDLATRSSARVTILQVTALEASRRLVSVGEGTASNCGGDDDAALIGGIDQFVA